MRIRNVTRDWDWTFGNSQSNYVRNEYAVTLDIQMKIKEWYGDCFFALQNGIPWQVRLGQHSQKQLLDNDLISTIQSVEGVLNITEFTSTTDGRIYRAQCRVYTKYSIEPIDVDIDTEKFING